MPEARWENAFELANSGQFSSSNDIMWHLYKAKVPSCEEARKFLDDKLRLDQMCWKAKRVVDA